MGRTPKVDPVRDEFLRSIGSARRFFVAIQKASAKPAAGTKPKNPALHPKHARKAYALAFLGVSAAWEEFLEQTTIRYMCGAASSGGTVPRLRTGKCHDLSHAYQVLSGRPAFDPDKEFLVWSSPTAVRDRASVFFAGGVPFKTPLDHFCDELQRAVHIRNRVAHTSESSKKAFVKTARHYTGKSPLSQGFLVGELLLHKQTKGFAKLPASVTTRTYFDAFMDMYEVLAKQIVS